MEAKSVQSGTILPLNLTQVWAQRCPSKWSPYISWQRWQLRRHTLRGEAEADSKASTKAKRRVRRPQKLLMFFFCILAVWFLDEARV